jgi:PleD family two-component response regulator
MDTKTPLTNTGTAVSQSNPTTSNSPQQTAAQNRPAKRILIIDSEPTRRKERVSALKQRGYAVFPALKIEEARSRCRRGTYDLIIVSTSANAEAALQLCEEIGKSNAKQLVLRMASGEIDSNDQNMVSDDPTALAEKVQALLGGHGSANPMAA